MIFKNDIYDIIIAQNDDYYISSIKELGIHESGSNEQESLSKCISKRDAYFNYCKANNIKLPPPISKSDFTRIFDNNLLNKIFVFFFNLISNFIFISLILLFLILFLIDPIESRLRDFINDPSAIELFQKILDKLGIDIVKK
jgi:hypothetical protein